MTLKKVNETTRNEVEEKTVKYQDIVINIYNLLMDAGMTQNQINEMDIAFYFTCLAKKEKANRVTTANQAPAWL